MMDDKLQPHTNGSPNGSNPSNGVNGHGATISPRRSISSKGRKGLSWSLNAVARLLTWYSIIIILFQCPASLDACDESSSKICKPYFHIKHAVAPHVAPYYDAYAAPYVELARPYYAAFDSKVVAPGRVQVVKYAGPRLAQVQGYGRAQWEKNVQPQILKYQALAKAEYDRAISPYVDQAATTLAPYYDIARTKALQTYHEFLVPTYTFVQPYATQGYDTAYRFTKHAVIPSTIWLWNRTYAFIDSAVWPHVRDVYILKVEPQLIRIGERLGRYKRIRTFPEETEPMAPRSTFVKPTSSVTSTTVSAPKESTRAASPKPNVAEPRTPEYHPESRSEPKPVPRTKEEIREHAAKTVAEDLDIWEEKFSKVAAEGASEIEDRVAEISTHMIQNHAHTVGKSLVSQLETTIRSELEGLKKAILDILEKGKDDSEKRDEELATAVRGAGISIRDQAQKVRDWRQSYQKETETAITNTAEEHFSILQRTQDLALQKIGMKWAWMDGVSYKDWQKYHQLRDRFEEWTEDLKSLITTHPGLVRAQTAGTDVEDEAMAMAQEAAVELRRLKQVAAWKAIAEDFSDDFDSGTMQAAAEAAEERIAAAAEAERLAAEATVGPVETGMDATNESQTDETADPTEDNATNSISSDTEDSPSEHDPEASGVTLSDSISAEPTESTPNSDPESDNSSDDYLRVPDSAEYTFIPNLQDDPEQIVEITEILDEVPNIPIDEDTASTTIRSAMFGAAAGPVPSRQPVFDDDYFPSDALMVASSEDASNVASAEVTNTVIDAIPEDSSATMQSESFQPAVSTAESSSLTEQPTISVTQTTTSPPYIAVSSLVSELLAGKEPSYTESVYSRLSAAYEFASPSSLEEDVPAAALATQDPVNEVIDNEL
ncbi:hypothetical protein GGR50DRAFT_361682 [Xylaria sp. CBS 124048]|nr:hypothetical protein GGR50DRAFT_361682 [Xylaria sp. CBS 124048]